MELQEIALNVPVAWVAAFGTAYKILQLIAKSIPDGATGFPGFIRKLAKVITLYVPNQK